MSMKVWVIVVEVNEHLISYIMTTKFNGRVNPGQFYQADNSELLARVRLLETSIFEMGIRVQTYISGFRIVIRSKQPYIHCHPCLLVYNLSSKSMVQFE